ncbi:MAG: cellulase family glycosylhydrolase [Lachnospiraceae bacterium]|nr:cellulase family glycosylhydrolase [Lachnospiraceae bacterium]
MWTLEKIWNWYQKQPWIVGFNYLPSNAVNSTEMWQKETFSPALIKKELQAASETGYNTCRVFLQYLLWKNGREELFACFESFLETAADCGIRVMPILFDDCAFANKEPYPGPQDAPVKGIHNSGWTPSPGYTLLISKSEQDLLKEYVTDFMTRYGNDDRILLWDLYNEPANREGSLKLLQNAFAWARECAPGQPLTAGQYDPTDYEAFDLVCAELSDIVSFHDYNDLTVTVGRIQKLETYKRPLICTEWLHRPNNNRIETHMPFYKEKGIGIINWGLVAGKTQTYLNWDPSKNPLEGMPKIWQHDIFYGDLTPYCQEEIDLIRQLTR